MKYQRYSAIFFIILLTFMLQACGSGGAGSNTNGILSISSLNITAQASGNFLVTGTTSYTPPAGKVPNGAQINITALFTTPTGTPVTRSDTVTLGSTGSAPFSYPVIQGAEPIFVTVNASIGDLHNSVSGTIPAIASLSATPSPLVFAQTDSGGTIKTITLNGGSTPYSTPTSNSAEISVSLSDSTTLSVTKIPAPGLVQKTATITVRDVRGNSLDIPVIYF